MTFKDLRDFIAQLEQRGALKRIQVPISPVLEMTEVCDRTLRAKGPALLFEKPTGFDMPVLGNLFGTPERVALGEPVDGCPNRFSGRIEELIYLGDHIRTRVSLLGHDDFIVKVPNRANHAVLRPGEDVTVAWLAEDCRALDLQQA